LIETDILDPTGYAQLNAYDVIGSFGVMHHIPSATQRLNIIRTLATHLKPKAWLVISLWQFMNDARQKNKILPWKTVGIDESEVEPGDYLLDWQKSGIPRYCHFIGKQELANVKTQIGMELIADFAADGKNGKLNRYLVFRHLKD
jgi:2-polyprenyl-3-methyl-5-hydroxy-6-metoxy-1,4-benzoquinol methylase